LWQFYWKANPQLKIKSKTFTLEEQKQQAREKDKFGWSLEELKKYLFDNCRDLAINDMLKYSALKKKEEDIIDFREKGEKQ
jgi:hypothetical protein